jgi:uncharacterized protein YutE (UPF0331/DUF86 family)
MVKVDVVRRKVTAALTRISRAESALALPAEVFLTDETSKDLASFNLFLAIQECIDLASHFVADEDWGPVDDAASAFDLLADHRVIDRGLAEKMRSAVGLRNLIAHGYSLVDHQRIQDGYHEGVAELRCFLAAVAERAGL